MPEDLVQNINADDFDRLVLKAQGLVMVDFGAVWCGPCKAVEKVIKEVAPEYAGRVRFIKIDVDNAPQLATTYSIFSVPTLLLFKDGKVVGQAANVPKDKLRAFLDRAL
jgi:thioredoxin 1